MNDIVKKSASDKLQDAMQKEGVTTQEAGKLIGLKPVYISMFKNPKHWRSVGQPQWDKLLKWVNSGYSLTVYQIHHPEALLPDKHVDLKSEGKIDNAEKSFEPPVERGTPFDEKLDPPEHIASGEPGNDNEITNVEFEDLNKQPPPVGLRPRQIVDEQRRTEIAEAILRYSKAYMPIPALWINELIEINDRLK